MEERQEETQKEKPVEQESNAPAAVPLTSDTHGFRFRSRLEFTDQAVSVVREEVEARSMLGRFGRFLRSHAIRTVLVLIIVVVGGAYYALRYSSVHALTGSLSPAKRFGSYERVVTGFIDYFPRSDRSLALASIPRGGTFAVASVSKWGALGSEGRVDIEVDARSETLTAPDVSIQYRIVPETTESSLYINAVEWPESFDAIVPLTEAPDLWFTYAASEEELDNVSVQFVLDRLVLKSEGSDYDSFSRFLNHALATGVLKPALSNLFMRLSDGSWASEVTYEAHAEAFPAFRNAIEHDEILQSRDSTDQWTEYLTSIRAGNIIARIDLFSRVVRELEFAFDMSHAKLGTMRASFATTVAATDESLVQKPEKVQKLSDLIIVSSLLSEIEARDDAAPAAVDSDDDGLTDALEAFWNTNKNNPDSDGDTFTDGEEVASGYNPAGEGLIEN